MDLRLSPDDRIAPGKAKRRRKKPAAKKRGSSSKATARGKSGRKIGARRSRRRRSGGFSLGRAFRFVVYWGLVLGVWAGIAMAGVVVYFGSQLPSSDTWKVPERPANIRIVATDGQLISNRGQMGGEAVAFRELPYYVPEAVIAIEDRRFMSHFGLDPLGILNAMRINLSQGRFPLDGNGGSTITQQVAKNLFLTPEQTIGRKIQEALLSVWLEQDYSKEQILELYLNRMYFGNGAYGIEAAAQRYFGKSASNISLGEAAVLAGLLQAPSRLAPNVNPTGAAARARLVLNAMVEEGYISPAEAKAAAIDPNKRIRTKIAGAEYYVADWVETLMQSYIGPIDQDVIVTTTIDWDLQKHAEFLVKEMVNANGAAHDFSQGALVAMDPDGAVRALVGGTDYSVSQYNRAVTARRQPGSSFKPFVYLSALEAGYTPDSIVEDGPLNYKGWQPRNYNDKYAGPVRLKDALANSLNTVSARLAIDVGPQTVVDTAMRMGISSPLLAVPSIALGTQEVSLLELTGAYAPFANGGMGVIAHVITRISTADGELLYQDIPAGPGRVVSPREVGEMNAMLNYAVEVGTGKKAQIPGWPVAGKTGTTQSNRDAVFVGYSARMITGVWLGNDDDTPMKGVGGGSYPAQLWSEFMQKAHQNMTPANLPGDYTLTGHPPPVVEPAPQQKRTLVDLFQQLFGGG